MTCNHFVFCRRVHELYIYFLVSECVCVFIGGFTLCGDFFLTRRFVTNKRVTQRSNNVVTQRLTQTFDTNTNKTATTTTTALTVIKTSTHTQTLAS